MEGSTTPINRRRRSQKQAAGPSPLAHQALSKLFLLHVCFFLSGAAGLIYQVVWSNALGLIFGHTVYAVATVLAVFMGGLTTGSLWIGERCENFRDPIAMYGWLELGVAASGASSLAGLHAVRVIYIAFYPLASAHGLSLVVLRLIGAAIVLGAPSFLMGCTLPALISGVTRNNSKLGHRLARLYWINTIGAVVGAFLAGFLLLEALGLRGTTGVAVSFNLVAGVLALWIPSEASAGHANSETKFPRGVREPIAGFHPQLLLACFATVGATAMVYEIGWTRLLATQLGSSTYAFTLMLVGFLGGIVGGSILFEYWSHHRAFDQISFAWDADFHRSVRHLFSDRFAACHGSVACNPARHAPLLRRAGSSPDPCQCTGVAPYGNSLWV